MSDDRSWQQRVRLSANLLLETVDSWCRANDDFPVERTVAIFLHLFSPKFNPYAIPDARVRGHLLPIVGTPGDEYSRAWPRRSGAEKAELIDSLTWILSEAVRQWNDDLQIPPIEQVNQQIVTQIVAHKYVVFHHYDTTRRDYGGFFGSH
jgi:hypothetical protein